MMKILKSMYKIIAPACALILAALLITAVSPKNAKTLAAVELPEFVLAQSDGTGAGSAYPDTKVSVKPASELIKSNSALDGASGDVLVLEGSDGFGVLLDYSAYKLSCYGIRSVTVRAYVPDNVKAAVISPDGGETTVARYAYAGYERNRWTEFTFYDDGINFNSGHNMIDFANESGRLAPFSINFTVATTDAPEDSEPPAQLPVYIDSIVIRMNDVKGDPKLEYEGFFDEIDQTAEKPLELEKYSAFDSVENRELPVTLRWEGASGVDEDGNAIEGGPYTLILETENSFGEKAEKRLTVKVRPRDNEPPVILVYTDTITVRTGTHGTMNISATDNEDAVDVVNVWSKNAMDDKGCLTEGEHELTLICTDDTGNTSTKSIKVIVSDEPEQDPEKLPVTLDESKENFGLPVWALILIIAAALILTAAVLLILLKKFKKKPNKQTEQT